MSVWSRVQAWLAGRSSAQPAVVVEAAQTAAQTVSGTGVRVFRGASYNEGQPDVVVRLHEVMSFAPEWRTVETFQTIEGLNLASAWTSDDCMVATGSISPAEFDAMRATPSD